MKTLNSLVAAILTLMVVWSFSAVIGYGFAKGSSLVPKNQNVFIHVEGEK